jgi:GNAT superfamily N-acetyltransferase
MDGVITYRHTRPGEEVQVCELVTRVFNEFVAPGFAPQGIREFLRYVHPEAIRLRWQRQHFTLVAVAGGQIVGAIEMMTPDHVSLLFVDARYQRRGISRELLRRSIEVCRAQEPGITDISVNSSPNAVLTYERLGFVQQQSEQENNGLRFVPMQLALST